MTLGWLGASALTSFKISTIQPELPPEATPHHLMIPGCYQMVSLDPKMHLMKSDARAPKTYQNNSLWDYFRSQDYSKANDVFFIQDIFKFQGPSDDLVIGTIQGGWDRLRLLLMPLYSFNLISNWHQRLPYIGP